MNFAQEQRNPTRHLTGFTAVVVLHIIIVYALLNGLARKVVEVVKGPLEVKVIEEVVKKPPPPDLPPPPPKLAAPPPPFIPPPEIPVAPPPVAPVNTITVTSTEAPPAPQTIVPVAAVPAPAAPAQPRSVAVVCPNVQQVKAAIKYPREAQLDGIQGEVVIEFTVAGNGEVKDVAIVKSSNRVFNRVSMTAVQQLWCSAQGQDVRGSWPIGFRLE